MEIKGFIDLSLIDWDGKISSVIFLPGCNMRCPFCYNTTLVLRPERMLTIPFEEIENYLRRNREWIDGVVITGGEPAIHQDLPNLCRKMRELRFLVKVDTNGTNPAMVRELIDKKLVDCIAMDVKAPLIEEKYSVASGVNTESMVGRITETVDILLKGQVEYEFRTTVVPRIHREKDVEEICRRIKGCRKYAIQNFKADLETVNPKFKELRPFSKVRMKNFLRTAKRIVPNVILRD